MIRFSSLPFFAAIGLSTFCFSLFASRALSEEVGGALKAAPPTATYLDLSQVPLPAKFIPKEDDAVAREFIANLITGDLAAAEKLLVSKFYEPELPKSLKSASTPFSGLENKNVNLFSVSEAARPSLLGEPINTLTLGYEIQSVQASSSKWFLGSIAVSGGAGQRQVSAFQFTLMPSSLKEGKGLHLMEGHIVRLALWGGGFVLFCLLGAMLFLGLRGAKSGDGKGNESGLPPLP